MLLRATFIPFNVDRRAVTIDGPRLMQGEHKRCQLNPATFISKALTAIFPSFSGSIFAVKPPSLLLLFTLQRLR